MKSKRKKIKAKGPESRTKKYASESKEVIIARVMEFIEPLCEAEGMELVHVEYQRERGGKILRLYIDKPGGITLDDCVDINRQAGDVLDVNLENTGPYSLEVSSPGSDRPLGKQVDFERFKGKIAKVKTTQAIEGKKNFTGVLQGISGGMVKLLVDDKTVDIPLREISKAHLVNYRPEPDPVKI
ncbi:ribosome maturation factor RimP [Thermodesulfobacteriota bacterium]